MDFNCIDEVAIASLELNQYLEAQVSAIAPTRANDLPDGDCWGYGAPLVQIAKNIKQVAASGVGAVWQIAGEIAQTQSRLNRKEYRNFVSKLLEWVGAEARKYVEIARAFDGFDFSTLSQLEPFTLLKLRSKRYAPVIAKMREELNITPLRVQELIQELVPKQLRKKKSAGDYGDAVLQRHADAENGTFYFALKNVNISDKAGLWLQEKLGAIRLV